MGKAPETTSQKRGRGRPITEEGGRGAGVNITMNPGIRRRIEEAARRDQRSLSRTAERAIEIGLDVQAAEDGNATAQIAPSDKRPRGRPRIGAGRGATLTITLNPKVRVRLEKAAKDQARSLSQTVERLIEHGLTLVEDAPAKADPRRSGRTKVILFRVTDLTRGEIEREALRSGRSLSAVTEHWLELGMQQDARLALATALARIADLERNTPPDEGYVP